MGMTAVQKILARASGLSEVKPGDIVEPEVDSMMAHDFLSDHAEPVEGVWLQESEEPGHVPHLRRPLFLGPQRGRHRAACGERGLRVRSQEIKHYYEGGEGVCHQLTPEKGLVWPGAVVLGLDSHATYYGAFGAFSTGLGTLDGAVALATGRIWMKVPESIRITLTGTPKAGVMPRDVMQHLIKTLGRDVALYLNVEYDGGYIKALPMNWRTVFGTMALELGGKSSFIAPDGTTVAYLTGRVNRPYDMVISDPDAAYRAEYNIDVSAIGPQVSPPELSESGPVSQFEGIEINQAAIGGCVAGFIEDLRLVARIMKGRTVKPGVRFYIMPGTRECYLQILREGMAALHRSRRPYLPAELWAVPGGQHGLPSERRGPNINDPQVIRGQGREHPLDDLHGFAAHGGGLSTHGQDHQPGTFTIGEAYGKDSERKNLEVSG